MPAPETNNRKIMARLEREGWVNVGGKKHDVFKHPAERWSYRRCSASRAIALRRATDRQRCWMELKVRKPATRYIVVVDGKPGAYGMYVPDMPGCTSMGDTIAELLVNAQEAVQLWAEDALKSNERLPKPRSIEAIRKEPDVARDLAEGGVLAVVPLVVETGRAVKANLSLDSGLLTAIDEAAAARGLTRSAFLASAAREKIAAEG